MNRLQELRVHIPGRSSGRYDGCHVFGGLIAEVFDALIVAGDAGVRLQGDNAPFVASIGDLRRVVDIETADGGERFILRSAVVVESRIFENDCFHGRVVPDEPQTTFHTNSRYRFRRGRDEA